MSRRSARFDRWNKLAFANRLAKGEEPEAAAREMGHSGQWGRSLFQVICNELGDQAK